MQWSEVINNPYLQDLPFKIDGKMAILVITAQSASWESQHMALI